MPRPTLYTPELAAKICACLAQGQSLHRVCLKPGMPALATVLRWLGESAAFMTQYTEARALQAEALADAIIDIADAAQGQSSAEIQAAKLRIDARKWVAAKLMPKKFGERLTQELMGQDGGPIEQLHLSASELAELAQGLADAV